MNLGETSMSNWHWFATVLAAGAWIPWLVILWFRFFRKGSIEFHGKFPAHLGHTPWGSVVILEGVVRSISTNMFLTEVTLTIARRKDRSTHDFEWSLFQPGVLATTGTARENWTSVYPIMLRPSQPQLYGITFVDLTTQADVRRVSTALYAEWTHWKAKADLSHPQADPTMLRNLLKEFQGSNVYRESHDALKKLCYWEPGTYSLRLSLRADSPDGVFDKQWRFQVRSAQTTVLENNVSMILEDICGFPAPVKYSHVQVELAEET